jgi:uncharacterized protein
MEIPALADLLDLQEIDLEIDRLIDRRGSLPELRQYREANEARVAAEAGRDALAAELREVELELDKSEGELEIVESKFEESEMRLYAGGMSSRETEHKRLEVRSLAGQKDALEERVLGVLDRREKLQAEVAAAGETLARARSTETDLEAAISSAWKEIDRALERQEARKAEVAGPVPPDLMELYEQLRGAKEGVAIGRLEAGQCGGCHLSLSMAEQRDAAESDPPRCVHCRRILVL